MISEVARRYGLSPQQVFTWRREARKLAASATQDTPVFVPAVVAAPPEPAAKRPAQPRKQKPVRDVGVIELEIDGIAMRVGRGADASPTGAVKVLVATKPLDFRKGAEGLAALVREQMGADPFGGTVFVFRVKRSDRIKLFFWDGTGMCLLSKRLEDGEFRWPKVEDGVMRLTAAQLSALLEGLDWRRVHEMRRTRIPIEAG
ncbi:IS66 family insertion sequence element accessory protein TnpB [Mesorhizobium captivum]|uniref:IS66 family insertion sequence element accessory protein TnpB n=1 Tax=Mesorhizobium captivum TaxID=3072319 RepID=UPI003D31B565